MGIVTTIKKLEEQFEKGYISGCTTSIQSLVQVVSSKGPGVYMMVVPAETVEDTLNEAYYNFVWRVILLLIMAIPILKILAAGQTGC